MVKLPLLKITQTIWFLIGLTIVLYFGRQILIPVLFACMLAMLMTPICNKLDGKGFHRIISSLVCVLILLLVFLLMSGITLIQLSDFIRDLPLLQEKTDELLQSVQKFIETRFHIPLDQQTSLVKSEAQGFNQMIGNYMRGSWEVPCCCLEAWRSPWLLHFSCCSTRKSTMPSSTNSA